MEKPEDALLSDELWDKVRQAYLSDTPTRDPALTHELACLRDAMKAFRLEPLIRYVITAFLGVGGAGVVFKVWDASLRTYRALKISRPIEGKEEMVAALLTEEVSRLQEVSHPNVISIFDAGRLQSSQGDLPFYTMTFLRGALPAEKYFAAPRSTAELTEFLTGLLAGVAHLHSRSLLHLDIKPSNVFVGEAGYAVLADLGGARRLVGNPEDRLRVICTSTYAHPTLLTMTAVSSSGGDDNRRRGNPRRGDLRVAFDLYALGRTLIELREAFDKVNPRSLSSYTRKYVALLSARLLDGRVEKPEDRPLGLTVTSLDALKYAAASEAVDDLDKLVGRKNLLAEIPELAPTNEMVIQVTRGQKTNLTDRLKNLLKHPLMRRLGTVTQLGLARFVYPGAAHTRLEHSIGTYSNVAQYITTLYNDPINPLFRQIIRAEDLVATLLAALLHDLGQYQHAHDLDDVEPRVFRHETLTSALLKAEDTYYLNLTTSLDQILKEDWDIKAQRVLAIIEADPDKLSADIRDRLLHTLLSGPLDADKLDYLVRDSNHCHTVFAGGIDRARLLATLTVVYERQGKKEEQYFALGIHEKGRAAAESVAFTRFQMFRAVYWHHTVRAAKAMLQRAAYEWVHANSSVGHDALKGQLYEFVLERRGHMPGHEPQSDLFEGPDKPLSGRIGPTVRPQWGLISHSDLRALDWLNERTTQTGQMLLSMLAVRSLYKRILVVSSSQNPDLWNRIQEYVPTHERLCEFSEELRKALSKRIEDLLTPALRQGAHYYVSGVGEPTEMLPAAQAALSQEGTVLLDLPKRRGGEVLRYYPEELHRGQREEFEESPSLAKSEVWTLLSEKLHELAGNVRIFVHPDIDILRRARSAPDDEPVLSQSVVEDELRKVFGLATSTQS